MCIPLDIFIGFKEVNMKKVLVVFLVAILFSGVAFSQDYEWTTVGLVEDGGEILGWMGVFRNFFKVLNDGNIYIMTVFYSYERRDAFFLTISILQEGRKTFTMGWADEMFDAVVNVGSPEAYAFPDGIDKKSSVIFYHLFPKGMIDFYKPFTIKYKTVFDTTWYTYDITKTQPAEREYWRRNKKL